MIPDPTACCASPGREWDPEEASIVSQHVGPEQPHARSRLQHCSFELVVEKWIELLPDSETISCSAFVARSVATVSLFLTSPRIFSMPCDAVIENSLPSEPLSMLNLSRLISNLQSYVQACTSSVTSIVPLPSASMTLPRSELAPMYQMYDCML